MSLSVGDMIICRGKKIGMIIEIDDLTPDENIIWAKVLWSEGRTTWEDIQCSTDSDIFEIVRQE